MIDPVIKKRYQVIKERYGGLQERLRDPLLTVLTILLALILFVIAPLHAAGAIRSSVGYASAIVVIVAVLLQSGISSYRRILVTA